MSRIEGQSAPSTRTSVAIPMLHPINERRWSRRVLVKTLASMRSAPPVVVAEEDLLQVRLVGGDLLDPMGSRRGQELCRRTLDREVDRRPGDRQLTDPGDRGQGV